MADLIRAQSTIDPEAIEKALITGDLSKLSVEERLSYYKNLCHSLGLNPLTKPFEYMMLNGKLVLYARRDCTDQLRKIHNVAIVISNRQQVGDLIIVTAQAKLPGGRTDESTGVVNIKGLSGDVLANAMMKAETKAKRRVTLSICGLGMLDGSELETIPGYQKPEDFVINFGKKFKGKRVGECVDKELWDYIGELERECLENDKPLYRDAVQLKKVLEEINDLNAIESAEADELEVMR